MSLFLLDFYAASLWPWLHAAGVTSLPSFRQYKLSRLFLQLRNASRDIPRRHIRHAAQLMDEVDRRHVKTQLTRRVSLQARRHLYHLAAQQVVRQQHTP